MMFDDLTFTSDLSHWCFLNGRLTEGRKEQPFRLRWHFPSQDLSPEKTSEMAEKIEQADIERMEGTQIDCERKTESNQHVCDRLCVGIFAHTQTYIHIHVNTHTYVCVCVYIKGLICQSTEDVRPSGHARFCHCKI